MSAEQATWFRQTFDRIKSEVNKVIVGQEEVVDSVLIGLAANGHILLEGMPGLGKTLLVKSLSQALSLDFSRIQFTPDMMPADVTGTNVLNDARMFEFRKGPIFANIVLADEINRATPKTQSALLEAMQERSVTVSGKRHDLEEPFLVMATQNPVEQEGTYPLPEAQLDRFFFKLIVPFPTKAELKSIVQRTTGASGDDISAVATGDDVVKMRMLAREVPISDSVLDYALQIILGTHPDSERPCEDVRRYVRYGSSPRGAQSLIAASKIRALLDGRFNVSKEDLVASARPVLRHRLILNFEAEADNVSADNVIQSALSHVDSRDKDPIKI
ncbi:MAG: MoxR family ATPase [Armatimonadota bacterium]